MIFKMLFFINEFFYPRYSEIVLLIYVLYESSLHIVFIFFLAHMLEM